MSAPPASVPTPRHLGEAFAVFWRHGSPRVLGVALVVALGVRLGLGGFSAWDAAVAVGLLLFWPVQEWLIHVFVLHARPLRLLGRTFDFRVPRMHRAHHRDPWRLDLVFIPFHSFLYTLPLLVGIWFAVTPNTTLAWTGITLHLALSLHYEWVHFLIHTHVAPHSRPYRKLWKNHRRHHFKNERYWFGVTMLAGDRWLGTAPRFEDVPTSPTCRDLDAARAG